MKVPALLALVVAATLTAPGSAGAVRAWHVFENRHFGHSIHLPPGWRGSLRARDGPTVITSAPVPNRDANPERVKLPRGGVYIWIGDYGRIRGNFPQRPRRIRTLGREEVHPCGFGVGYELRFRDQGHVLQVFVKLAPHGNRALVLAVLNTLRVTARISL